MKRKGFFSIFLLMCAVTHNAFCDESDLDRALRNTQLACSDIDSELSHLKTMAGVNTAVTAVGTVSAGVALGTGLAKKSLDAKAEQLEKELEEKLNHFKYMGAIQLYIDEVPDFKPEPSTVSQSATAVNNQQSSSNTFDIEAKKAELDKLNQKSKLLGNIRTGTLAGAAATNVAGAIIASTNRVKGDLSSRIKACINSVDELQRAFMSARLENTVQNTDNITEILRECGAWKNVNLSKINNRSTGAAVSSGVGAAMAISGTVTSAVANTDATRNDNSESGKKKEKDLNTASNVLAGGSTLASGVATVFNATQISAIKDVLKVAENCEKALKK